jgi:cysteine dioxygenase
MARLGEFLEWLRGFGSRVPLLQLEEQLAGLDLSLEELREQVNFDPEHYKRNLLSDGPGYQALILCWLPGQESPIHDHTGSSCAVKVLGGVCTEIMYDWAEDGSLTAHPAVDYPAPGVRGAQDQDMHIVGNRGTENLVTLHIYTPPLLQMNTYAPSGEITGSIAVVV